MQATFEDKQFLWGRVVRMTQAQRCLLLHKVMAKPGALFRVEGRYFLQADMKNALTHFIHERVALELLTTEFMTKFKPLRYNAPAR